MAPRLGVALAQSPRLTPAAPPAPSPPSAAGEPLANQGAYQLGKVRILGVPVITVAAPVLSGAGTGPDATTRARVIEGNLAMLYRGRNLCTQGEALAEALVHRFLAPDLPDEACGLANASLLGPPDALTVEVVAQEEGLHSLEARVVGRPQPLPLLTVTPEDARLNGLSNAALATRWQGLLQERLRLARTLMQPEARQRRLTHVVGVEAALLALLASSLWCWRWCRQWGRRLEDRLGVEGLGWRQSLAIQGVYGLSLGLFLAVGALLFTLVGVAVLSVPGQVPTALDLLLQPWGIAVKLAILWLLSVALQTLLGLWLRQWMSQISQPAANRKRRQQRYRSLLQVLRRLVNLLCLVLVSLWILVDVPGVKDLSVRSWLAGGALLGALAIVFQGLLRDVVAGLTFLLGDHFAIGDTVEIRGIAGEVCDLGLLSTELRCGDQRTATFPNSSCAEVLNHTKLRSGAEVEFTLAHSCGDLRRVLGVISAELGAFAHDPAWQPSLLKAPELRGLTAAGPRGLTVAVQLVTVAGAQGPAGRELRLRLLERLRQEAIPLAEGGTS
ncbi:MAG: mechanosensitive ion channel domain-containing protein [Cyanobium sp.]